MQIMTFSSLPCYQIPIWQSRLWICWPKAKLKWLCITWKTKSVARFQFSFPRCSWEAQRFGD